MKVLTHIRDGKPVKFIFASITLALITCLFISGVTSFAYADSTQDEQTKYDVNVGILGPLFGRILPEYKTTDSFDYRWISTANNKKYNAELASFANTLSTDIYKYAFVAGPSGRHAIGSLKTPADYTYLLKDMGFTDVRFMDLGQEVWPQDQNDVSGLVLAHRKIFFDGEDHDIFIAVVRGTQEAGEWTSDLDPGANTADYTNLTGAHPEWTNKQHHKGFDVLANRLKTKIDAFVAEKSSANTQKSMLITGHSRGAAESNILGTFYENDPNIKTFTYAFSCPLTTLVSQEEASKYKTIFNFCEKNDLVGHVPLRHWGYTRYGTDIIGDALSDSNYKSLIDEMMGTTFYDSDKTPVIEGLNSIANNTEEFYVTRTDKTTMTAAEVASSIAQLDVKNSYSIAADGTRTYNDSFFLQGASKLLEDMMALAVKTNSFESVNKSVSTAKGQTPNAPTENLYTSNDPLAANGLDDVAKDLLALDKLVAGTNCEKASKAFTDAADASMLMPHLTATTFALTKVAPAPSQPLASIFGEGNIGLIVFLIAIGIAAIVGIVIYVKVRK